MTKDRDTDGDDGQIRPFAAYLQETNRGRTHADLSKQFHELIGEVLDTGKPGSLKLEIKVSADDAEGRRLVVVETVTSKLPQPDPRKSIFFADDDGNLTRNDPNQLPLGIQLATEKRSERHA